MTRRFINRVTRIAYPVRTGQVEPSEVTVHPREHSQHNEPKPARTKEPRCDEEERGASRDPYRAQNDDHWSENNQAENGYNDGEAGEYERNGHGYQKGEDAEELLWVWHALLKKRSK